MKQNIYFIAAFILFYFIAHKTTPESAGLVCFG